ncbi:MAG: hypothetical protein KIT19_08180 [Phycisphaeraceae bacterium]|nr:hypothetical protein [Phycisphaeraceae bacterium]
MSVGVKTLTESQYERLSKIIYERSGIHFPSNKKYVLESRLGRRLDELSLEDFDQYVTFLTVGPYRDDEFQEMFNRITINETSFFRNEPQLKHFETVTLAALLEARATTKRLRIWSAACSTGEEPYTLAMQVHRSLGIRLADWRVEILATDISEKVLEVAQAGRYNTFATRSLPPLILTRYFKPVGNEQQIDPTIQSMVRFEHLNLKDTMGAKRFGSFDVIFCRNVMIYFDDTMKSRCLQMFSDQLASDGTLFVGHSESFQNLPPSFESVPIPYAFAFTKRGGR